MVEYLFVCVCGICVIDGSPCNLFVSDWGVDFRCVRRCMVLIVCVWFLLCFFAFAFGCCCLVVLSSMLLFCVVLFGLVIVPFCFVMFGCCVVVDIVLVAWL